MKLLIGVVLWRNSFSVVTLAGYELVATLFQSMAKHLCLKISAAFARCDHHDDDSHQHHNHNNHDPHQHNNHHHDHQPLGVAPPWAACRHTIANQSKRHHDPHQQRNHLEMLEFHKFKKIKSSHFENVRISEFQKKISDRKIRIVQIQQVPNSAARNFKMPKRHDFKKIKLLKV